MFRIPENLKVAIKTTKEGHPIYAARLLIVHHKLDKLTAQMRRTDDYHQYLLAKHTLLNRDLNEKF